jgi:hypothetical protein
MGVPTAQPRIRNVRVKTGCLTCRARRKKCDEAKPICSGCARNFIDCNWPFTFFVKGGAVHTPESDHRSGMDDAISESSSSLNGNRSESCRTRLESFAFPLSPTSDSGCNGIESVGHQYLGDQNPENEASETAILWQPLAASFISPRRATLLTQRSLTLFQHYVESTSTWLAAKPLTSNPFIKIVLPLAWSDDLLMHAVLALSGTHLTFRKGGDLEIQAATRAHYSLLLRDLRTIFADEALLNDTHRISRLLLVLVVLCHVEVRMTSA